jgi:sulfur-oxidizing protein SoxY
MYHKAETATALREECAMTLRLSRREALALGAAGVALATAGTPAFASLTDDAVSAFAGDAEVKDGLITVDAPEIAENGNSVPIEVSVESAMEGDDMVEEILVLADGNPNPAVATFRFSKLSGEARASTRIRLAKTQNVVAVARMKDGSIHRASRAVKVTIGGCGG